MDKAAPNIDVCTNSLYADDELMEIQVCITGDSKALDRILDEINFLHIIKILIDKH